MKISRTAVFILVLLPILIQAADLTLQDVVDRHTKAMGGSRTIEAVKTIRISLQITEPTFNLDAIYIAERRERMRIDLYSSNKRVYTEVYDGAKGWEMDDKGVATDSTPSGSEGLLHGILMPGKMFGLHEMTANHRTLELEGREIVDGVNYYVLQLTLRDGFVEHYYINPDTWMIDRSRDIRALHPDVDPSTKWFENRYTDYRPVEGVLRSFHQDQVDLKTGKSAQQTDIKKIEINPELKETDYIKPSK